MSQKPLKPALRRKWDNLIATEGAKMGLTDCVPFLENKMLNDIFYRGLYKGQRCIVKCSSRAPDSIHNEYVMAHRLYTADPAVIARPLAHWVSRDGKYAFAVIEEMPGKSLAEMLMQRLDDEARQNIAMDLVRIAKALAKAGIVWRDLIPSNFLCDASGHYRLIDAQLAIDRKVPHECRFMKKHRLYRIILFAYNRELNGQGWCDADCLEDILARLNSDGALTWATSQIEELRYQLTFLKKTTILDRLYLSVVRIELIIQSWLRGRENDSSVRERLGRVKNFLEAKYD